MSRQNKAFSRTWADGTIATPSSLRPGVLHQGGIVSEPSSAVRCCRTLLSVRIVSHERVSTAFCEPYLSNPTTLFP